MRALLSGREAPPRAMVRSFGCQLNVADGEKLKGLLLSMGWLLTDAPEEADLILLNTCAVREHAEQRVFGILGSYKQYAARNPDLILGISGCMASEETVREKLRASYPFVRLVLGTGAMERLPEMLHQLLDGERRVGNTATEAPPAEWIPAQRTQHLHASVPIMYGCNNFCTYCIVPYVRGRERSRTPDAVFAEVEGLVAQGCREISLLGQNVNSYGRGLDIKADFPSLLRRLDEIPGEYILRFLSSHPKDAGDDLIAALRDCKHVEPHLHLPVQSGSDRVLAAMNRRYTTEDYLRIVEMARRTVPGISLTTDIIVGFPGETAEDFEATLALIKQVRFDNLFPFVYSKRSGTKAAKLPDDTSDAEKTARIQTLLTLQKQISEENFRGLVGQTIPVLIDSIGKGGDGTLTGRAPGGVIVETAGEKSHIGSFRAVEIIAARNWSVAGRLLPDLPLTSVREPVLPSRTNQ